MKPRPIRIDGDLAFVPLTKGYEAVIDAADVPLVDGVNWHAAVQRDGRVYVKRSLWVNGKHFNVMLHRVIAGTPAEQDTDHKNGNGLDNRRANLRNATTSENMCNQRKKPNTASELKGIHWNDACSKWRAKITIRGQKHSLGLFATQEAAHEAYCQAARSLHGEFARTA
jgi:hypothetical protein